MEIIKPDPSFSQWRKKIIKSYYIIIIWLFVVEMTVFLTLRDQGLMGDEYLTDFRYLITYVATPVFTNVALVLICQRINMLNIKSQIKNYTVVLTSSLMSAVVAYVHYDVFSVLTVFSLPVFLTILFGQKKMTNVITGVNSILLILSIFRSYKFDDSIFFYLNLAVAFTMMIVAAIISSVLIAYNEANTDYIYSSYQKQLSLREQVRTDSMTGLLNQKAFRSLLKACLEKAKGTKTPMTLAIIDIDYFKEINDTYGHMAGDQVLIKFTQLIKNQCYDIDGHIARYGGDEFTVIFQGASKELAYLKLEMLRHQCTNISSVKTGVNQINFSAGIAQYLEGDINETLLFNQADTALYQAKENGRGNTIVYLDKAI
ncbi:MAG: GGDEF domain-containing protein [Eubacteriales bacterium]|nr:GGDEF domain-containing protein [Eubacteriales bacterium]MDD3199726.1 GGDEF domain-containing protein [Eubacteriales bacterium]MDD4121318.1 GGDEF domain-containing protein [Eubacteriales bacterium]MDD4630164.1 GGDEF domain-containing protein [Eubacteriales bacterium]